MIVVYIASAYTIGDVEENVKQQINVGHQLMDLGFCPVLPLLSHFMHLIRQRDYEEWMKIDYELINRSDYILRLPGESKGADREVEYAKKNNKIVVYSIKELLRLNFKKIC